MATKLLNNVTRELLGTKTADKYRHRPITVTLEAGDLITFHIKGTRQRFTLPLAQCFKLAQLIDTTERFKRAMGDYREKVKAGARRLRKPRKPQIPYSQIYFNATAGIKLTDQNQTK